MKHETQLKIIFMGTPEFGAVILEKLCMTNLKPILVVTAPDKPVGRKQILTPSPVKIMAQRYKIPVGHRTSNLTTSNLTKPDLIVVAAYGQILPREILEIPKFGCLNVHPSLLPQYRGSSPIQYAILNGDKETGITIILMDAQMDHGPILAQKKTIIGSNETAKQLHDRLAVLGSELLIDTIPDWIRGQIKLWRQDEKRATYAKILKKDDGKINWKKSAEEIERQIRAFDPWPGTFTSFPPSSKLSLTSKIKEKKEKMKNLKILKARILKTIDPKTYPVGKTLVAPQNELCIQCGKGFLVIEKLQPEGKKPMGSEEFMRGHSDFIGTILK